MKRWMFSLVASAALATPVLAADGPAAPAGGPAAAAVAQNSVLSPTRTWYAPNQPIEVKVAAEGDVTLVLTEFLGVKSEPREGAEVAGGQGVKDVRKVFPILENTGTYLLYVVPKGKEVNQFVGTPLVLSVRGDRRMNAPQGAMVTKVQPLQYVAMKTNAGTMNMAFYYDKAPNTVDNFLSLSGGGFYDGLTFHRIVPEFVIQGGDPRGDGSGGPGYQIDEEFNDRQHQPGVLSMARSRDLNSAGSQFFVCLKYERTKMLDKQYTAFGKVVSGMDVVTKIATVPVDPNNDRPQTPQVIENAQVVNVTADNNPYPALQKELGGQ